MAPLPIAPANFFSGIKIRPLRYPLGELIVANKSWEADPLVAVCLNHLARPTGYDQWEAPDPFSDPSGSRLSGTKLAPRCACTTATSIFEIWCIEDWMADAKSHSSSLFKMSVFPKIFDFGRAWRYCAGPVCTGILPLRFAHPAKIRGGAAIPVTDLVH
jgi:hypothetical protein